MPDVPRDGPKPTPADTPESHVWLEDLLDTVWRSEANWRFDDHLDLVMRGRHE